VKTGDTLSDIANEIYGRAGLWTVIRDANRDAVGDDGSRLRPGMVLKIPPAPHGARR
jgi:nucleoid-associated protein YgaU